MKKITVYVFDELTNEGKEKAIDKLRDINVEYDWFDADLEYWGETLETIGINDTDINFSGFSSQGDGASFTGIVDIEKFLSYLIFCSMDYKESKFYNKLLTLIEKDLIHIDLSIARNDSRYCHAYTCHVDIDYHIYCRHTDAFYNWINKQISDLTSIIEDIRKTYCKKIYKQLNDEYDYLTGDEAIQETIEANNYHFFPNGTLAPVYY